MQVAPRRRAAAVCRGSPNATHRVGEPESTLGTCNIGRGLERKIGRLGPPNRVWTGGSQIRRDVGATGRPWDLRERKAR